MEKSILGQLLMLGVPGPQLDLETGRVFQNLQPGGFILFGRNIQTVTQLRRLVDDLRDLSHTEPIIAIDQEGGRVSRLKLLGNEPPNAQQLREKGDLDLVRTHGSLTGELLRLFGFNLDLCPVLDISLDDAADNSLRGRCYGLSVEQVVRFAGAFNQSLRQTGVLTCGKHFPGYAAAGIDPHLELPRIDRTIQELEEVELAVFRAFIEEVSSIMVCHAWYPAYEPTETPASLSSSIVRDLLLKDLRFEGLVLTDDLDMGAIISQFSLDEAVERAIRSGNHMAMLCHRVALAENAFSALSAAPRSIVDEALNAIDKFKQKLAAPAPFSEKRFQELNQQVWNLRVAALGPEKASERSPEDGKRSPVEIY